MPRRRVRAPWVLALITSFATGSALHAQDSSAARVLPPIEIHGFLQVYYRAGDPTINDGFRLRKADLKFSGDLSPHLRWRIGFDAAKALTLSKTVDDSSSMLTDMNIDQRSRILQDAALTYLAAHDLQLDIGQQLVPLSLEGAIPTSQVETIERSMFIVERSRGTGLGDVRDIGVSANGRALDVVEYHVGLFNETGESQGTTDPNDQKAIIGRVVMHPWGLPKLEFGGSGAFEGGPTLQRRERAGGEVQYRGEGVTLRAEAMSARDGSLRRFGWYTLGAVRPTRNLQFVARYDSWDRDRGAETSLSNAFEQQIVAGGSYLIDGGIAKFAVNVVRQTFPNVPNVPAGTVLLTAFQAVW